VIGAGTEIGAGVIIAGRTKIGKDCKIKIGVLIRNRINIADKITIGMGSNVIKDLTMPGLTYCGNPCIQILGSKRKKDD